MYWQLKAMSDQRLSLFLCSGFVLLTPETLCSKLPFSVSPGRPDCSHLPHSEPKPPTPLKAASPFTAL